MHYVQQVISCVVQTSNCFSGYKNSLSWFLRFVPSMCEVFVQHLQPNNLYNSIWDDQNKVLYLKSDCRGFQYSYLLQPSMSISLFFIFISNLCLIFCPMIMQFYVKFNYFLSFVFKVVLGVIHFLFSYSKYGVPNSIPRPHQKKKKLHPLHLRRK